jgi:hypothetical protein
MADETISVTSLRPHTYDGIPRPPGTQYLARVADVATLKNQCMAIESATIAPPPEGTPTRR